MLTGQLILASYAKAVQQLTSFSGPGPFNESMFLQAYNCLMDRFVKTKFDQVFSDTTQLFGKMDSRKHIFASADVLSEFLISVVSAPAKFRSFKLNSKDKLAKS